MFEKRTAETSRTVAAKAALAAGFLGLSAYFFQLGIASDKPVTHASTPTPSGKEVAIPFPDGTTIMYCRGMSYTACYEQIFPPTPPPPTHGDTMNTNVFSDNVSLQN